MRGRSRALWLFLRSRGGRKVFTKPTLIDRGRQDTTVGYRDAWEILESYPRATFAVIDRRDHGWPTESPRCCSALVDDWLGTHRKGRAIDLTSSRRPHARLLRRARVALPPCCCRAASQAQDWPTKPITDLHGLPAGSGVDVVARMLQPSLEKSLGQRLVIDYKPGAGGNVASEVVARAAPDGYTFLLGTGGDARRQCRALQAPAVRRRGRLHADLDPERRLQRADGQSPAVLDAGSVRISSPR
jgi:hypothetical protein